MNKCLWCNSEVEGFCCLGGGKTLSLSNTGEKTMTKSYCFNDFLTVYKISVKSKSGLSEQEKFYLLHKEIIDRWYKEIPFQTDGIEYSLKREVVSQNALD